MKWKEIIAILSPAIDKKSVLPILHRVLLRPYSIEATDLEYSVRIAMGGTRKVEKEFALMFEEVKALADPEFFYGDENITVKDGASIQKIDFCSSDEYPLMHFDQKSEKWITIPLSDLVDALSAAVLHIDPKEPRTILTGANFRVEKGNLRICGTDTRSLTVWRQKNMASDCEFTIGSPGKLLKSLKAIQKAFPGFEEVYIGLPEGRKEEDYGRVSFTFSSAPMVILVSLLAGKYPEIEGVFPQDFNAEIEVGLKPIQAEMKKYHNTFRKLQDPVLFLTIEDKKMLLFSVEEGLEFAREFIPVEFAGWKGYKLQIAYDPLHFERCLASFRGELVGINFVDKNNPTLFCGEEERLTVILMPLRIKDPAEEESRPMIQDENGVYHSPYTEEEDAYAPTEEDLNWQEERKKSVLSRET